MVGDERRLVEDGLYHLFGYDHARPVRIGKRLLRPSSARYLGLDSGLVLLHTKSLEKISEIL